MAHAAHGSTSPRRRAAQGAGRRLALCGLLTWLAASGSAAAAELIERTVTLARGEARLAVGAGAWLRENGNLTVGTIDLRFAPHERLEVRLLLPGITGVLLTEGPRAPALAAFFGISEVGFNSIHGATLGLQAGLRSQKRLLSWLRLGATVELRHRLIGQENAELAVVGPLPPSRAALFSGDALFQLHPVLALHGALGYTLSIGEGRSFGFGQVGLTGTIATRLDVTAVLILERSRADRVLAPVVFGGIALAF